MFVVTEKQKKQQFIWAAYDSLINLHFFGSEGHVALD